MIELWRVMFCMKIKNFFHGNATPIITMSKTSKDSPIWFVMIVHTLWFNLPGDVGPFCSFFNNIRLIILKPDHYKRKTLPANMIRKIFLIFTYFPHCTEGQGAKIMKKSIFLETRFKILMIFSLQAFVWQFFIWTKFQ